MTKDKKVTLSEAAGIIGVSRQTLWEWSKKGWLKPLKAVSKTGGRPAQIFSASEVISVAQERLLISEEQAGRARKQL